jgi:hypothetical protein
MEFLPVAELVLENSLRQVAHTAKELQEVEIG